ncbi:MAG TPA: hypothetical protein VFB21_06805 [Chthonomonadaceae bacterium]|nr:hypothetical protein [Chthonomonadaceae bacterium]
MFVDAPLRTGRRVIAPLALLLLALAGIAAYLWYGRIQADRALEDATLEQLRQITAEQPRNARAFHYLGLRLTRARQPVQAFEAHARAAKLDPDDEEIWAAYAGATNAQHGPTEAFRVMDDFLKRHPDNTKLKQERDSLLAILKRGAELFTADKHYNEAIRSYRYWLAEEPDNAQAQQALDLLLKKVNHK